MQPKDKQIKSSPKKEKLETRRKKVLELLLTGKINLHPQFDLKKDWPIHPLVVNIRKQIIPTINKLIKQANFLFDPQDLEHQVLFRLTTFAPSELFKKGSAIEEYFEKSGIYNDWQKIPLLDSDFISKFRLKREIILPIIKEQFLIIQKRMNKSNLPRNLIFSGIKGFSEIFTTKEKDRYVLKWENICGENYLTAAKISPSGNVISSIPVEFKKVNKDLGREFMQELHYIHTPRFKEEIFGFYLEKSKFPFAIQTVTWAKDSTRFRQDGLLVRGFNPEHCIELRRLYTWPGSPRNIIGVLDRLIIDYYKKLYKNIEAVTTTVMPMYAKTRSTTIASGIDQILYVRSLLHKFFGREINGKKVWENIIPPNQKWLRAHQDKIIKTHQKFPMYPTIGVFKQVCEKSFDEFSLVKGKIIGFNFK